MTNRFSALLAALALLLSLSSVTSAKDTPHSQAGSRYIRMAHNFFVFYDPTITMDVPYKDTGLTRIEAQKYILEKSNASLPPLNWQAGLYPHWKGELWLPGSPMAFKPYYRLHNYQKGGFGQAIGALPTIPQSPPMLQTGLMKLEHLLGLPGRTEIFLFSDGKHMTYPGLEPEPLKEAKLLASRYDICLNIVSSAQTAKDRKLLDDIAAVNSCSQVIDFDTAFDHPEHLFGKLYMDTWGQGFSNILFDFDKSFIRRQHHTQLNSLGRMLKESPELYVVLSGFCDSIGSERYNIGLSQRRAESVQRYLQNNFGISKNRILLYWYGYANPVASNTTPEGRQLNRRVTIVLRGTGK
nr:OmpA family protein [uncultured Desulfobulbus sp.]